MSTISLLEKLHVGRRLSGSSSKLSLRDEDMEFLDFNINDISRASSPASVSAKSESHLQRDRRHRHSLRGDDEYRRRCHKLKSELEAERDKVKAIHRDKIEEMRQIREYYEEERKLEHAALKKKLEEEKQREVSKLKEELMKVKDYELQQVLKYKEDQLRHYRAYTPGVKTPVLQIPRAPSAMNGNHTPGFDTPKSPRISDRQSPEFTDSLATTSDRQTPGTNGVSLEKEASRPTERTRTLSGTKEQTHSLSELQETGTQTSPLLPVKEWGQYNSLLNANAAQPRKKDDLEQEIEKVMKERDGLEEQYNSKCADYERKAQEFHQMKQDYENELRRVISEYKKVALGNLQKLKIAEHALREGAMSEGDVLHISLANPDKMVIPTLPLSTKETQGQREAQKKDEVSLRADQN